MKKVWCGFVCLFLMILLAGCGCSAASQAVPSHPLTGDALNHNDAQQITLPTLTPTPPMSIPSQQGTPSKTQSQGKPSSGCVTYSHDQTLTPAKNGELAAPYGSAPTSAAAQTYASELLQLINHERAACGLPAFTLNSTLVHGALLHSWNMYHCGFSHTCPDGMSQCQRIANEGFAGQSDCGETIGGAGNSWSSVYTIQESMEHEAANGWHRIHLFSTTLHQIGIGVYVTSGYVWFTEDMVS